VACVSAVWVRLKMTLNVNQLAKGSGDKLKEVKGNVENEVVKPKEINKNEILKTADKKENGFDRINNNKDHVLEQTDKKSNHGITKPSDKLVEGILSNASEIVKKNLENEIANYKEMLTSEEAQKKIDEVGDFSVVLQDVLMFFLKKTHNIEETLVKEIEARKIEIEAKKQATRTDISRRKHKIKTNY